MQAGLPWRPKQQKNVEAMWLKRGGEFKILNFSFVIPDLTLPQGSATMEILLQWALLCL